jgi:hypothetical protein
MSLRTPMMPARPDVEVLGQDLKLAPAVQLVELPKHVQQALTGRGGVPSLDAPAGVAVPVLGLTEEVIFVPRSGVHRATVGAPKWRAGSVG